MTATRGTTSPVPDNRRRVSGIACSAVMLCRGVRAVTNTQRAQAPHAYLCGRDYRSPSPRPTRH